MRIPHIENWSSDGERIVLQLNLDEASLEALIDLMPAVEPPTIRLKTLLDEIKATS